MLIENGLVRVGMEIEIPYWDMIGLDDVTNELFDAGYIYAESNEFRSTHQYHCGCSYGCSKVRAGRVMVPPIVAVQYDASLPDTGGEFITSPVIMAGHGINELKEIFDIVTRDAVWDDQEEAINGDYCSPSIHLHISCLADNFSSLDTHPVDEAEVMTTLECFVPEMFMLADLGEFRRGMTYRLPTRKQISSDNSHHGWIQPRACRFGHSMYLEWRLWEAEFRNWEYVNRAAYLGAALARVLIDRDNTLDLLAKGLQVRPDITSLDKAYGVAQIVEMVEPARLDLLEQTIVQNLHDDTIGIQVITGMFEQARSLI